MLPNFEREVEEISANTEVALLILEGFVIKLADDNVSLLRETVARFEAKWEIAFKIREIVLCQSLTSRSRPLPWNGRFMNAALRLIPKCR